MRTGSRRRFLSAAAWVLASCGAAGCADHALIASSTRSSSIAPLAPSPTSSATSKEGVPRNTAAKEAAPTEADLQRARQNLSAHSHSARTRYTLARLLVRMGRLQEGLTELQAVMVIDPHFEPAFHSLQRYYQLAGFLDREYDILRRMTALPTRDPRVYLRLAQIDLRLHWLERAHADLARALSLAPYRSEPQREMARCEWMEGRPEAAIRRLQGTARQSGDDMETAGLLAQYLLASGRAPEAETLLREELRRHPGDRALQLTLLFNLVHQGGSAHWNAALALGQEMLRQKPPAAEVYCWLGRAYDGLHRPQAALAAYEQAVKVDPTFENGAYALGQHYLHSGRIQDGQRLISFYSQIRANQQSFGQVQERMQRNPNAPGAHLTMARWYQRAGDHPAAIMEFRRTLALRPDDSAALNGLRAALRPAGRGADTSELSAGR